MAQQRTQACERVCPSGGTNTYAENRRVRRRKHDRRRNLTPRRVGRVHAYLGWALVAWDVGRALGLGPSLVFDLVETHEITCVP